VVRAAAVGEGAVAQSVPAAGGVTSTETPKGGARRAAAGLRIDTTLGDPARRGVVNADGVKDTRGGEGVSLTPRAMESSPTKGARLGPWNVAKHTPALLRLYKNYTGGGRGSSHSPSGSESESPREWVRCLRVEEIFTYSCGATTRIRTTYSAW